MHRWQIFSLRRIYTVCVTVDNFNVFEAKIEKTNFFNSASGTIAISIDDLDVYEDYFDSEICFLHRSNWQPLCEHHHNVKTMTEDRFKEYRF